MGFCSKEGLAPASFHAWKRRLRRSRRGIERESANQALVPVQIVSDPKADAGRLEVQWPGGVVLRVQGCDAQTIGAVVAALGGPGNTKDTAMLTLPSSLRVFAKTGPTDMRKSFEGLVGVVERELGQQVESGDLFLFFNRRGDRVKVLWFAGDGLVIWYKRLEGGTFEVPKAARTVREDGSASPAGIEMRVSDLTLILEGIDLASVRHRPRWRRA